MGYQTYFRGAMLSRRLTGRSRPLPHFLIIGAQKCGTASLFAYLTEHPQIDRPLKKEVHFFDLNYERGESWYRAVFPVPHKRNTMPGGHSITGEATPYYLFHPHAARRAAETVPSAKLIVLLRDPVARAYSQHRHRVRAGSETRDFEQVIEEELVSFPAEHARMVSDERYRSPLHRHSCYLARGRYREQLEMWARWYPRESILVVQSEELFRAPETAYARTLEFLGVDTSFQARFAVHNPGSYGSRMDRTTEDWLRSYFEPHNRALNDWLGYSLTWP